MAMQKTVAALVLLATVARPSVADDGPFAVMPFGWRCETRGNIHYWTGECRDMVTDVLVEFAFGSRDDFRAPCGGDAYATERRGVLASLDYCESFMPSAASYTASRFLAEAPDLIAEMDEWPLPSESLYLVEFWDADTEWAFSAVVTNECERARVRELLLDEGRLARW